jgi:putative phosphoesterase
MKLGLISDIHADYDALGTVLDRLATIHQIDRLLCAGDLTGYGTQPNEVIDLFRQSTIITVRGNHDSPSKGITEANAAYLENLPFEWRETIGGKTLYMCHGIPGVNFVGFTPGMLLKDTIRAMIRDVQADIIIAGHTHEALCQQIEGTWILNPGSLYAQFLSTSWTSHSYAILDLSQSLFSVFDLLRPATDAPFDVYSLR